MRRVNGVQVALAALAISICSMPAPVLGQTTIGSSADANPASPQTERAVRRAAREQRRAERRRAQAVRAAQHRSAETATYTGPDGTDIVVVGLRQSVEASITRKRKAKQIVDVVTSEDAGKLPDNNVVEALARVPGINITRQRGQGSGFTIRGLDGVQTTLNGSEVTGPAGRALDVSAVPAELIKSVEVYKNRTADQVEGGIAGTVNIELRRPLDLAKRLTMAGSFRESYNSQGSNWSPYASLLIADRFDTGIGEIGFLLNGGYQDIRYSEPFLANDSVDFFYDRNNPRNTFRSYAYGTLPEAIRNTAAAPFRINYGIDEGRRKQPSLSGVLQWRPSAQLNFILEGSYFGSREKNRYSSLYVNTREDFYRIDNPRTAPSGVLLGYDIINDFLDPEGRPVNFGQVNAGINATQAETQVDNYHGNFEVHWADAGVRIDSSAQYDRNIFDSYSNGYDGSFPNLPRVRVDFDNNPVPGGGPSFNFFDVDPRNPANQRILALRDNVERNITTQYAGQIDLGIDVSTTKLLRSVQLGTRYRRSENNYGSSYRSARWFDPATQPLLGAVPGVSTITLQPDIRGGLPIGWAQLNPRQLFDQWDAARAFIVAGNPDFFDGPGNQRGLTEQFAAARPSSDDPVFEGSTTENVFSAYAMANYAFQAGFPIDGNVGLRYNNTYGGFTGRNIQVGRLVIDRDGRPVLDADGNQQFLPDQILNDSARANYVDLLPSAFATVHFMPKLQLRGSYSYNVQRPAIQALRTLRIIDTNFLISNPNGTVNAGNPDLKPTTTHDFNAALEWNFGHGGLVSITGFYKKQQGFIYETRILEPIPELNGLVRFVQQPRNAGPGKTAGVEAQATGFFSFMPGFLRNLGASVNGTWIPTAELQLPFEPDPTEAPGVYALTKQRAPFVSRYSYNLIGYYETPVFSARVAYNWRSKFRTGADAIFFTYVGSARPQSRLDAAVNLTPIKFLTLSVEGGNLLNSVDQYYSTTFPELPLGLRQMGRTVQISARFRY